jgi:ketosteroid isomerase-like protein
MSQENVEVVRGVRYRISLPSGRASQRRTLDERLFLRFPAAYRVVADRLMRLPPRSRLRRLMLTHIAERAGAAVNRRDFDVLFLALDPGIEYHPAGDQRPPGMDEVSQGHAGYREVWRQMIDSFEDFHAEPEELLDLGDQLLATTQYRGHGSGSGVPVNVPLFQLMRLRQGLVIWQKDFSDRSEALEAAARRE